MSELPVVEEHALRHSKELEKIIRAQIDTEDGQISFAQFMQMALYEPGFGYYSAGSRKLGVGGDFTTAPEISSLFSTCLARQCAEIMSDLDKAVILELGAGTGVMACDVLLELEKLNALPAYYYILEPSADLQQRQQQLLTERIPELVSLVSWLDSLPEQTIEGIILANEVIDAMPARRFCLENHKVGELVVEWRDNEFNWKTCLANAEFAEKVKAILQQPVSEYPDAYSSEINTDLENWMKSLSDCLARGLMLFIDYGYSRHEYYHEQRTQGTLLCHYQHQVHSNPFLYVGLQDITASVDFTAVAEAGFNAGLSIDGFTPQAYFLLGCGIEKIMEELEYEDVQEQLEASRQIKLLTLPGEMGERFKVIALGKNIEMALSGFSLVDHRRRL
jgi:SAM-dependent MidA family methyltransferase